MCRRQINEIKNDIKIHKIQKIQKKIKQAAPHESAVECLVGSLWGQTSCCSLGVWSTRFWPPRLTHSKSFCSEAPHSATMPEDAQRAFQWRSRISRLDAQRGSMCRASANIWRRRSTRSPVNCYGFALPTGSNPSSISACFLSSWPGGSISPAIGSPPNSARSVAANSGLHEARVPRTRRNCWREVKVCFKTLQKDATNPWGWYCHVLPAWNVHTCQSKSCLWMFVNTCEYMLYNVIHIVEQWPHINTHIHS